MLLRANLRAFENQYHQRLQGTFEDSMWGGYVENMRRVGSAPRCHEFWAPNRALYSSDFAAFVEEEILGARGGVESHGGVAAGSQPKYSR